MLEKKTLKTLRLKTTCIIQIKVHVLFTVAHWILVKLVINLILIIYLKHNTFYLNVIPLYVINILSLLVHGSILQWLWLVELLGNYSHYQLIFWHLPSTLTLQLSFITNGYNSGFNGRRVTWLTSIYRPMFTHEC